MGSLVVDPSVTLCFYPLINMSIQSHIKAMFASSLDMLGSEPITLDGVATDIPAIINETDTGTMLGVGAKNTERNLIVQFPVSSYSGSIKSGQKVTARGEAWQVASEPGAIRRGQVAITLTLVEPERRSDF